MYKKHLSIAAKLLIVLLIGVMIGTLVVSPPSAHAQPLGEALGRAGFCIAANWVGDILGGFFNDARRALGNLIPSLGDFLGSDTVPTSVMEDMPRGETEVTDCITSETKQILITALLNSVITFVLEGDTPHFITNFKDEFTGSLNRSAGAYFNDLAGRNLCAPIRITVEPLVGQRVDDQLARLRGESPRHDPFACTLTGILDNVQDIESFRIDFRAGGWNAWTTSFEPSHNTFLAYLMLQEEAAERIAATYEADRLQIEVGSGFRPFEEEVCDEEGECKTRVVTPASLMGDTAGRAVAGEFDALREAETWWEMLRWIGQARFVELLTGNRMETENRPDDPEPSGPPDPTEPPDGAEEPLFDIGDSLETVDPESEFGSIAIHSSPGGPIIGSVLEGRIVNVIDGPQFTADGRAWYRVCRLPGPFETQLCGWAWQGNLQSQ